MVFLLLVFTAVYCLFIGEFDRFLSLRESGSGAIITSQFVLCLVGDHNFKISYYEDRRYGESDP